MRFYLGTHHPHWLGLVDVPLFVSRRRLVGRKRFPRALGPWVLDSGGFTQLAQGAWHTRTRSPYDVTPAEYAAEIRLYAEEIGGLEWAAPMDWMCEPEITARHDLGVAEHQSRTVTAFQELRAAVGSVVAPVLQGWELDDYLRHIDDYYTAGVDLADERIVGVGSVCRRGADDAIVQILDALSRRGLRLHAFGIRSRALRRSADCIVSADSMAWSYAARMDAPLPGHEERHKSCANCIDYALDWYDKQLDLIGNRLEMAA